MENRTDLALESYESQEKTRLDGVVVRKEKDLTIVDVVDENGAKQLGKPVGKYITYNIGSLSGATDIFDNALENVSGLLSSLLPENASSVLVAGIGNTDITADALGPACTGYVLATRHIKADKSLGVFGDLFNVSSISTGVLGDTGIESAEIVKGVVSQINPSCVIAVDALAASSADRLGTTVQLSDTGISPGSGVGNHRHEISFATLGVPVISVGIPTVVSTSEFNAEDSEPMFVTPREIDKIISQGARLIGMAINTCLQKSLSTEDILSLIG